jgi:phage gp36-like protein
VPSIVKKWAVSFARYHLHRDGAPDNVVRDYKDALGELKDAAGGRMALPGAAGAQPPQSQSSGAMAASSPATFTDQALEGWR